MFRSLSLRVNRRSRLAAPICSVVLIAGTTALPVGAALASPNEAGRRILETTGLSIDAIRGIGDDPLIVELDVAEPSRQAALVGLMRVGADPTPLFEAAVGPKAPPLTLAERHGTFSSAEPAARDLSGLRVADDDYELLERCRPSDCRFKLDAEAIEAVQSIDWSATGAEQEFLEFFRRSLDADVTRYRDRGLDGLITYADKPRPYPVADGVRRLQRETAPLLELYPDIRAYLEAYPAPAPASVSDHLVWTLSDFGFRPTLSVDHLVVGESGHAEGLRSAVVLRTIYASHYLAGRLQLAGVIDGEKVFGVPGHFVLAVDQILFDDEVGRFKRMLLGRGLASTIEDRLIALREQVGAES
jgi:hypothetical protein